LQSPNSFKLFELNDKSKIPVRWKISSPYYQQNDANSLEPMKLRSTLLAGSALIIGATQLFALDNEDLIKLLTVGLDDATIILKMKTESADYDLSTDGLIALKQVGASDAVIQAALRIQSGIPETPPPSSQSGEFSELPMPSITVPVIQPQIGAKESSQNKLKISTNFCHVVRALFPL
jgi:hypothetical protein